MISIKPLAGSRLFSKVGAQTLRKSCSQRLSERDRLIINLAGVKDMTGGFAFECFGKLYNEAKDREAEIYFKGTKPELKPILLTAIRAAKDLASTDPIST